jgi:DNA polymerase III alpha subunit (gram-positive type)
MDITNEPIVWFDLETGGTNPRQHQITQIAAVATIGNLFEPYGDEPTFERKIELVDGHYTEEALTLQGYDEELWATEAMPIHHALQQWVAWLAPFCHEAKSKRTGNPYQVAHCGGYNLKFDVEFCDETCHRQGGGARGFWLPISKWRGGYIDVLDLVLWGNAMQGWDLEDFKLETVCKRFGVPIQAHDALGDAKATVQLARAVTEKLDRDGLYPRST